MGRGRRRSAGHVADPVPGGVHQQAGHCLRRAPAGRRGRTRPRRRRQRPAPHVGAATTAGLDATHHRPTPSLLRRRAHGARLPWLPTWRAAPDRRRDPGRCRTGQHRSGAGAGDPGSGTSTRVGGGRPVVHADGPGPLRRGRPGVGGRPCGCAAPRSMSPATCLPNRCPDGASASSSTASLEHAGSRTPDATPASSPSPARRILRDGTGSGSDGTPRPRTRSCDR